MNPGMDDYESIPFSSCQPPKILTQTCNSIVFNIFFRKSISLLTVFLKKWVIWFEISYRWSEFLKYL